MLESLRTATRRRAVLITSGAVVLVAVGGGTTAAFAASGAPSASPSTSASAPATCAPHLRALLRGAEPAALKADLKTLHAEPKGGRAAERQRIRAKALAGAYGARVGRVAHIVAGGGGKATRVSAASPAALKADLKTLRAAAPRSDARKAQAQAIEQKALAGGYGTTVQQRAKAVQERVQQRCAAKAAK